MSHDKVLYKSTVTLLYFTTPRLLAKKLAPQENEIYVITKSDTVIAKPRF